MIKIETIQEIYDWDTNQLWNAINLLEEQQTKTIKKELEQIKNGYKLKIPIIYIIKEWTEEYPESKRITIKGHGKYNIIDYYDEITIRNTKMRQIILDNYEETTIIPRNN